MLLAAALVPTACVLWFMGQAMGSERLAAHQRLIEAYRTPLELVQARLAEYWSRRARELPVFDSSRKPPALFAELLQRTGADSIVLHDPSGVLQYPNPPGRVELPDAAAMQDALRTAQYLEFEENDPAGAAVLYEMVARGAGDPNPAAQALLARARCLIRAGQTQDGIRLLVNDLSQVRFQTATDEQGRLIAPSAWLMALQSMNGTEHPDFTSLREKLVHRLNDYADGSLPAGQRRFLMDQLLDLPPTAPEFPTLEAERLAGEYTSIEPRGLQPGQLSRSGLDNVWQLASTDRTAIALYRHERLMNELAALIAEAAPLTEASIRLVPAGENPPAPKPLLSVPAGAGLPGWQLLLDLGGTDPFAAAAQRRRQLYLWIGVAVAALTVALTGLVGRYVGRQVKLTRLKNDLIATVSHELKTPLASIRALVDTLLDPRGQGGSPRRDREYLELIARENLRLSRLIENFLAFSRMERNKHAFEFGACEPALIVAAAVEAAGERFATDSCRLDVEVAPDLPAIHADSDALTTVLLNLLDNAYKYTSVSKRIRLHAFASSGRVCFEVTDNGIGLSRRALKRVFDRFYQVDQSLSRQTGGCGLGLSIVRFIVDAHGGSVSVRSQQGKGSTFTVAMPAVHAPVAAEAHR
jgi:signal transduction histidine kinase